MRYAVDSSIPHTRLHGTYMLGRKRQEEYLGTKSSKLEAEELAQYD